MTSLALETAISDSIFVEYLMSKERYTTIFRTGPPLLPRHRGASPSAEVRPRRAQQERHGRRWGFEFKCTDAPRTTKFMHVVMQDLGLAHLWVLYPGDRTYPLADTMTALPLKNIHTLELRLAP